MSTTTAAPPPARRRGSGAPRAGAGRRRLEVRRAEARLPRRGRASVRVRVCVTRAVPAVCERCVSSRRRRTGWRAAAAGGGACSGRRRRQPILRACMASAWQDNVLLGSHAECHILGVPRLVEAGARGTPRRLSSLARGASPSNAMRQSWPSWARADASGKRNAHGPAGWDGTRATASEGRDARQCLRYANDLDGAQL